MTMLAVEDLNVHYGVIHALKGISFQVKKGEIFTLLGSNGAGKTTTLKALSGLLPKTGGRVFFNGQDVTNTPSHTLPALGLVHVPEGRRIFAGLSVAENLLLGAYHRRDRAEIKADLESVYELFPRLAERRKQDAGSLSGGEQQMLAMGRGLMSKPQLLLLDEPSMAWPLSWWKKYSALFRRSTNAPPQSFWWSKMSISPAGLSPCLRTGNRTHCHRRDSGGDSGG